MKNWKTIKDESIRIVWRCTDEDCECEKYDCIIDPQWHQDNGTPTCQVGKDMKYIRTEVADCSNGLTEGQYEGDTGVALVETINS